MDQIDYNAWRANITEIIEACASAYAKLIFYDPTGNDDLKDVRNKLLGDAEARLAGLKLLFSPTKIPSEIAHLQQCGFRFSHNRQEDRFLSLIAAIDGLKSIAKNPERISFGDIFDDYKDDAELNELADHLIQMLERLIDEHDRELDGRLLKDLTNLLERLKGRPPGSLSRIRLRIPSRISR